MRCEIVPIGICKMANLKLELHRVAPPPARGKTLPTSDGSAGLHYLKVYVQTTTS